MTLAKAKLIVDACGYAGIMGAFVVHNVLERTHGDYVAVAGALALLVPIGVLWRIAYYRIASHFGAG